MSFLLKTKVTKKQKNFTEKKTKEWTPKLKQLIPLGGGITEDFISFFVLSHI